jgi:hypothetical protein
MLLITALGAAFRPPPWTRTPWVIWATLGTFENQEKHEDNENNQECLSTIETCHLRGADKINPWMNSLSIYPKSLGSN